LNYASSGNENPNDQQSQSDNQLREKLKDVQIFLFPIEHYKIRFKKLFNIKFGNESETIINEWYRILKLKFSLLPTDYIEELHRKMEVQ